MMSENIADKQRISYLIGVVIGILLYTILLFFNSWDPISLVTGVFSISFSAVSGVIMRFLSGLGLSLTYATFCSLIFRHLSPLMKGSKARAKMVIVIVLLPAMGIVIYGFYTIWSALYFARPLTDIEFLSMIFGVWSLMIMVYVLPTIKGEYSPEIEQTGVSKAQEKVGNWKFSVWKGYKSYLRKDYGGVYEKEFERYGLRLFMIRAILSGLVLLPISLILISITPLAILSIILWLRMFSLNYKHYSTIERSLLTLVTLSVAVLTTVAFFQPALIGYTLFFDVSYGIGLLSGIFLLFVIILRR
jgi:hypothetical protein